MVDLRYACMYHMPDERRVGVHACARKDRIERCLRAWRAMSMEWAAGNACVHGKAWRCDVWLKFRVRTGQVAAGVSGILQLIQQSLKQ